MDISAATVVHVRKRCAKASVQKASLPASTQRIRRRQLDGNQEAFLIALIYNAPPDGSARWMLRLLAHTLVEMGYLEHISHEMVRQVLLANEFKHWIKKQ